MTKEEVINLMLDSINKDNREFCKASGMSPEETENNISQSQMSLGVICSNLYNMLKEKNIIS